MNNTHSQRVIIIADDVDYADVLQEDLMEEANIPPEDITRGGKYDDSEKVLSGLILGETPTIIVLDGNLDYEHPNDAITGNGFSLMRHRLTDIREQAQTEGKTPQEISNMGKNTLLILNSNLCNPEYRKLYGLLQNESLALGIHVGFNPSKSPQGVVEMTNDWLQSRGIEGQRPAAERK